MNESKNNGPVDDGINERERDPLHEKLCAYLLGEANEAERAEMEAALAESPELRAERIRLAATIGLVRTTLSAEELSPTASAALQAAAQARRPRATPRLWYRSPVVRLAAGLAAIGLTWAVWSGSRDGEVVGFTYSVFSDGDSTAVAKRDAPSVVGSKRVKDSRELVLGYTDGPLAELGYVSDETVAKNAAESTLPRDEPESRRGLGYIGGDSVGSAAYDKKQEEQKLLAKREGELLGSSLEELDARAASQAMRQQPATEALPADGGKSGGRAGSAGPSTSPSSPPPTGSASPGAPVGSAATGKPSAFASRPAVRARKPSEPSRMSPGAVQTGSDDFFLGMGAKGAPPQQESEASPFIYNMFGDQPTVEGNEFDEQLEEMRELGYAGAADELRDLNAEVRLEAMGYTDDGEGGDRFANSAASRSRLQGHLFDVLDSCQRYPHERPRDMFFRFFGDNPFQQTVVDPLSTFAADVDTASYTLARRYLVDGVLPEKAQVRTEEFVNYFDADVPAPLEETFAIHTELAPSRFGERGGDSWMLRVAVRGKDVTREERQPLSLTFVIDVSGSMKEDGRLELVKHALRLLFGELDARDSIAIVAFSKEARVVLPMTSAKNRSLAETAIYQLQPDGGTNAEAGLRLGYELARSELASGSHHRVVLLSDGVANIGATDQHSLSAAVEEHRRAGIYLNTVGVGMGNHNDALLEQLADKGDGVCNYVDDAAEARRALVERFTGAFEPIARDVKIQVEFDPAQVQRYRLLGYENRAVADRDFRNDAVDAGEVNAGHQVVALYELSALPQEDAERPLAPLATVRLRFKPPHASGVADVETEVASEIERAVTWKDAAPGFSAASFGYRRSVLVAQFAEFLRRSVHARYDSLDELLAEVRALAREQSDPDVTELIDMIARSHELILAERAGHGDFWRALESVREACYLEAELEELNLLLGRDRLHSLEDTLRELADRIRLLRERVEAQEFSLRQGELEAFQIENERLAALVSDLLRELSTASRR